MILFQSQYFLGIEVALRRLWTATSAIYANLIFTLNVSLMSGETTVVNVALWVHSHGKLVHIFPLVWTCSKATPVANYACTDGATNSVVSWRAPRQTIAQHYHHLHDGMAAEAPLGCPSEMCDNHSYGAHTIVRCHAIAQNTTYEQPAANVIKA